MPYAWYGAHHAVADRASNPVAWWARYVPQLWLFPLIPAVFILAYSRSKVLAKLAKGILVFGLIDIIIIGVTDTVSNFRTTREIRNFIASQRESGERLVIEDSGWRGTVIRLREHNVDYRVVDAHRLPCLQPERIPHSDVAYCREAMAGSRPR